MPNITNISYLFMLPLKHYSIHHYRYYTYDEPSNLALRIFVTPPRFERCKNFQASMSVSCSNPLLTKFHLNKI